MLKRTCLPPYFRQIAGREFNSARSFAMLKRTCLPPYFLVSIAITVAAGLYAHYLGRPAWAFMVASASVAAVVGRGIDRGDLMSIPAAAGTIAGVVSGAMV